MTLAPGRHLLVGPRGPLEVLAVGSGEPVSGYFHGLTGTIDATRTYTSAVPGTRVVAHLGGHGGSVLAGAAGGYPELAAEAVAVLEQAGARRALGISMGAGALLTALAAGTAGLDRVVLCLPPRVEGPPPGGDPVRDRCAAMADAVDAGDAAVLTRLLVQHQPAAVRRMPAVSLWARRHAQVLVEGRASGLAAVLRAIPATAPVAPPAALAAAVAARPLEALVIAQEGDDVHPVADARVWAGALGARLEVLGAGDVPWKGRARVRHLVAGFLGETALTRSSGAPDTSSSAQLL